jgi:hypothetical protein
MNKLKVNDTKNTNWFKFENNQLSIVKELVGEENWQLPILSTKGSFIVWASTTVHSAKLQTECVEPILNDRYLGWRGVVYVCYRPKEEFDITEIRTRAKAFNENRVTNHWSLKIFDKRPGFNRYHNVKKCQVIEEMLNDPIIVYNKIGKPLLSIEQKKLIGL